MHALPEACILPISANETLMKSTQSIGPHADIIDIQLKRAGDLFASLDPSPLVQRDLAPAVEEFLVESALDKSDQAALTIRIRLPALDRGATDEKAIGAAVANYFTFMREREAARVRRLFREGRQALGVGLLFLALCTALGQSAYSLVGGTVGTFLREGLMIIGWVANWRPIEIFLYDWRPMRRRRDIYDRLARAEVEVCIDNEG